LLKGTSNERFVRLLRSLNPTAKIIATAEMLGEVSTLLAAGADYVSVPRLREADDLLEAVRAASKGLLYEKRAQLTSDLENRREILD
jgi:voltage-gated potassium channel Kch